MSASNSASSTLGTFPVLIPNPHKQLHLQQANDRLLTPWASSFAHEIDQLVSKCNGIDLLSSKETLINLTINFLSKQEDFRSSCKPISAEIAFHYTAGENLQTIQHEGLLDGECRRKMYGRGVYVGNNPHAFVTYGEVGLVVLVLKGAVKQMFSGSDSFVDPSVNSFQANKLSRSMITGNTGEHFTPSSPYFDEVILRNGSQVLPFLKYPRELTNNADLLWELQKSLQLVVDRFFNDGRTTLAKQIFPDLRDVRFQHKLQSQHAASIQTLASLNNYIGSTNNSFMPPWNSANTFGANPFNAPLALGLFGANPFNAPLALGLFGANPFLDTVHCRPFDFQTLFFRDYCTVLSNPSDQECPICLLSLDNKEKAVSITECKHCFHESCLEAAVSIANKCPMCRCALGEPYGNCPFGTMEISKEPDLKCDGFESFGTFVIKYHIPHGIQGKSNVNPGQKFQGTTRMAFLPDTSQGQDLLERLRYAFSHGMTFTVGTSLTTAKANVIIWASIHHKTSNERGPYGFPDVGFFANCNEELDALNVPQACDLQL
jgi:deltex-like protein